MKHSLFGITLMLLTIITPSATAEIITFEHRSNTQVGGRIGNQNFRARFVITAFGDTDDRIRDGNVWIIEHFSASIEIENIGTFDFITPTLTFVVASQAQERVGFSRADDPPLNLFTGPSHPDFADWDMTTSIGPIRGFDGSLGQWGREPVETTGGILFFDIWDNMDVTFTATVIPAPAVLALFGVAGLVTKRRRRRNK